MISHEVHRGIHVLLTRKEARSYKKQLMKVSPGRRFVIMRCTADWKHLVALGSTIYTGFDWCHNSAVFMQVNISKDDWNKSLKGKFR